MTRCSPTSLSGVTFRSSAIFQPFLIIKPSVSDLLSAAHGPFVSLLRGRTEKCVKINRHKNCFHQDCPSAQRPDKVNFYLFYCGGSVARWRKHVLMLRTFLSCVQEQMIICVSTEFCSVEFEQCFLTFSTERGSLSRIAQRFVDTDRVVNTGH